MNITSGTWTADTTATAAAFSVSNFVFNRVSGAIDVVSASVLVDASGQPKAVEAELDAVSFRSGNAKRDADITSKKFLHVETYPTMRFASNSVSPESDGWTATGKLHVGEHQAPLTLTVHLVEEGDGVLLVEAAGVLDRAAAGVRAPSFLIGRDVEISVRSLLIHTHAPSHRHPVMAV